MNVDDNLSQEIVKEKRLCYTLFESEGFKYINQ